MRVRLTTAARAFPETVLEPAPDARLSAKVVDLPDAWAAHFIETQQTWWALQAELAEQLEARRGT